jgi:hypothetical protein
MKQLTDIEKLKYWIDAEFSILHAMFGIIMFNLMHDWFWKLIFVIYVILQVIYASVRILYVATQDKDYLKVPKK